MFKRIMVRGLVIQMDVCDNADVKEIQERLNLINAQIKRKIMIGGIVGIERIQESDVLDYDRVKELYE